MTLLHAHSDPDFTQHLRAVLKEADGTPHSVDIAVGYFYLSGFRVVADLLADRPGQVRLLLGRTDRPTQQEIAAGYGPQEPIAAGYPATLSRTQEVAIRDETVGNVGRSAAVQPQEDASAAAIKSLAALIAGGKVEVRAYLKERLHAKAYIGYTGLASTPGTAIIGSTNFSASGFSGNTELNYPVTHGGDVAEVRQWFERLWADSEPVSDRVVEQLQASWPLAAPEPYLIYLKILYELYGDTLGDPALPEKPPVELTDYQQDAVAAGLAMLARHNGCYIADVVGLGKTYIGAEILRRLTRQEPAAGDPLVICPAPLTAMWERVCDQFGIIDADVLSIGRLTEAGLKSNRDLKKILRNAGPVLIDEAHNFRNNNQRRRVLLDFLKGNRRHKTILLSATPQNLAPRDILRQLELFLDPVNHGLPGIAEPLHNYFPEDLAYPLDDRAGEVLRHILLRRRRRDIVEYYPHSSLKGQPIRFPDQELVNQNYSLEHAYRQAGGLDKIVRLLKEEYQASRYRHAFYLTAAAKKKPEYWPLQNPGKTLAALMRVLLFKRLESSIPAFRSTLENLIKSNWDFRDQILSGAVGQDDGEYDAEEEPAAQDAAELDADYIALKDKAYPAADFRCRQWARDLEKDAAILQQIHDGVKDLTPADDAKLDAIKKFVADPGVKKDKLLIFTESQVTARYLYRELKAAYPQTAIDLLTGEDSKAAGQDKMARFSPVSNGQPDLPKREQTKILIATDVLSQGQNLQDCGRALNYDLHWNPVTIIQRYGRIDRITTKHEVIRLHNMLPDAGVDQQIDLTGKLGSRVQAFHDFIGLDAEILNEAERVNRESIYAIYDDGKMPEMEDRMDGATLAQEANGILNRIRREQPELWNQLLNMPDGLRAALTNPAHPNADSTLMLLRAGAHHQIGYASAGGGEVIPLPPHELAIRAACSPDTPALPLPPDTNQRIARGVAAWAAALAQPAALESRRRDDQAIRYIDQQLAQLRIDRAADDNALRRIESLRQRFATALPASVNAQIRNLRRQKVAGSAFLQALAELESWLPPTAATRPLAPPPAQGHIQVVCSLGIATAAG